MTFDKMAEEIFWLSRSVVHEAVFQSEYGLLAQCYLPALLPQSSAGLWQQFSKFLKHSRFSSIHRGKCMSVMMRILILSFKHCHFHKYNENKTKLCTHIFKHVVKQCVKKC